MSDLVFLNNKLYPKDSLLGLLQDLPNREGLFTTIRVENGAPIALYEHLERLFLDSLHSYKTPWILKEEDVIKYIDTSSLKGLCKLNIIFLKSDKIMIINNYREEIKKSISLGLLTGFSNTSKMKELKIKKRSSFLSKRSDDLLLCDGDGVILEALFSNIFWVDRKTFYTPKPSLSFYFGNTISRLVKDCKRLGLNVEYVCKKAYEIPDNSSIFTCNAMKKVQCVHKVNLKSYNPNFSLQNSLNKLLD